MRTSPWAAPFLLATLALFGCQNSAEPPTEAQPSAGDAPASTSAQSVEATAESLRVVCWDDYVTPEIVAEFKERFGIDVEVQFINNNEEVIERLEAGEAWDVWTPSDYAVQAAVEKGLLAPLDRARIPNLANIGRRYQNAIYDKEFAHSVPFYWGTTGLGYDKRTFPTPPASWAHVFDAAKNGRYRGKIGLLDDVRETMAIALIASGADPNSTNPSDLARARDLLIAVKPALEKLDSESYEESLASGRQVLTHGWSGDLSRVVAADPNRGYALPKEGFMLWIDNLAIPSASPKKASAEVFINFLLEPEISAKLTNANRNPTTVPNSRPMIDPAVLSSPSYELPENGKFHVIRHLGESTALVEKYWQEFVDAK